MTFFVFTRCAISSARIVGSEASEAIRSGRAHREKFAPPLLVQHLREDAFALEQAGLFYRAGSGDRSGESDTMRAADSCDPISRDRDIGNFDAFFALWERLDEVRQELADGLGMPLLPEMEISYVRYPVGGYYQRHVDDVADADTLPELRASSLSSGACASETSRRAVSFVCSLVEGDWDADRDGGALRTFPAGRETEDLPMVSGDLILFDSCLLDHEVRSTRRERLVLVGWWHTPRQVENP